MPIRRGMKPLLLSLGICLFFVSCSGSNDGNQKNPVEPQSPSPSPSPGPSPAPSPGPNSPSGSAPDVPANFTALVMGTNRIDLSWSVVSNASGYRIQISNDGTNYSNLVENLSGSLGLFSSILLDSYTTYYYRIQAYNSFGSSDYSSVTARTHPTAPPAPHNFTAQTLNGNQIRLNWQIGPFQELTKYRLESSNDGVTYTTLQEPTAGTNQVLLSDQSLDKVFHFRIFAVYSLGDSLSSDVIRAATTPSAPSGLAASVVSNSELELTWTDNSSSEANFIIEQKGANDAYTEVASTLENTPIKIVGNLASNTQYTFRVRASNSSGISTPSNIITARTALDSPPGAPIVVAQVNYTPPAALFVKIILSNTLTSAISGFKLERRVANGSWGVIQASIPLSTPYTIYNDTTALHNQTYFYRARAISGSLESSNSTVYEVVTPKQIPNVPTNFAGNAISQSIIDLSWQHSSNASNNPLGFYLERSTGGAAFARLPITLAPGARAYRNAGLTADTEYKYRLQAYNNSGASAYTPEITVRSWPPLPGAPGNLVASQITSTSTTLTWTDAENEASYEIFRVGNNTPATTNSNVTTYTVNGLTPNTSYSYRVRAKNAAGTSAFSNVVTIRTLKAVPNAPTNVRRTGAVDYQRTHLAWNQVSATNVEKYRIERAVASGSFTSIAEVTTLAFVDIDIDPTTSYQYRIVAINNGGSATSAPFAYTTPPVPAGAPHHLQITSTTTSSITIGWSAGSTNTTSYEIYRVQTNPPLRPYTKLGEVSSSTLTFTDISPGGNSTLNFTYWYLVLGKNGTATTPYSDGALGTRASQ